MRKQLIILSEVARLAVCAALLHCAVRPVCATIADNTEPTTWVGSYQFGQVSVSNSGVGLVSVAFSAQDPNQPPVFLAADIVTGGDPSVSPFVGDYVAAGISHIAFKVRASVATSAVVAVVLNGGYSGCTWTKIVNVSPVAGSWVTNIVSVGKMDGWQNDGAPNAAEQWIQDIRDVRFVGVRLIPRGTSAQSFEVSSFILVGPDFATAPALLVSLGDALKARFGIRSFSALTSAQKDMDADGDGMTDLQEILAGTNPDDRNSIFAAQVVGATAEGVKIRWPCVEGGVYTVSRTSDLVGETFVALPSGSRLMATSGGYMEFTDSTVKSDGGPYFYRIVKE